LTIGYARNRQRQLDVLTRLGSTQNNAKVSATFSVNGREFKIERSVTDYSNAKLNGKSTRRPENPDANSQSTEENKDGFNGLRIFVSPVRATHLFGQEKRFF